MKLFIGKGLPTYVLICASLLMSSCQGLDSDPGKKEVMYWVKNEFNVEITAYEQNDWHKGGDLYAVKFFAKGKVIGESKTGYPVGTVVRITGLDSKAPARLQFMNMGRGWALVFPLAASGSTALDIRFDKM